MRCILFWQESKQAMEGALLHAVDWPYRLACLVRAFWLLLESIFTHARARESPTSAG
jgi:hypothetical protein